MATMYQNYYFYLFSLVHPFLIIYIVFLSFFFTRPVTLFFWVWLLWRSLSFVSFFYIHPKKKKTELLISWLARDMTFSWGLVFSCPLLLAWDRFLTRGAPIEIYFVVLFSLLGLWPVVHKKRKKKNHFIWSLLF